MSLTSDPAESHLSSTNVIFRRNPKQLVSFNLNTFTLVLQIIQTFRRVQCRLSQRVTKKHTAPISDCANVLDIKADIFVLLIKNTIVFENLCAHGIPKHMHDLLVCKNAKCSYFSAKCHSLSYAA